MDHSHFRFIKCMSLKKGSIFWEHTLPVCNFYVFIILRLCWYLAVCFYTISRLYYSIAEIRNDLILGKINRGPCVFPFHGLERRRNLQHENGMQGF